MDVQSFNMLCLGEHVAIQWSPTDADTFGILSKCPDKRGVLISWVVLYTRDNLKTAHSVCITVDIRTSGVSARWGSTVYNVGIKNRNDICMHPKTRRKLKIYS